MCSFLLATSGCSTRNQWFKNRPGIQQALFPLVGGRKARYSTQRSSIATPICWQRPPLRKTSRALGSLRTLADQLFLVFLVARRHGHAPAPNVPFCVPAVQAVLKRGVTVLISLTILVVSLPASIYLCYSGLPALTGFEMPTRRPTVRLA